LRLNRVSQNTPRHKASLRVNSYLNLCVFKPSCLGAEENHVLSESPVSEVPRSSRPFRPRAARFGNHRSRKRVAARDDQCRPRRDDSGISVQARRPRRLIQKSQRPRAVTTRRRWSIIIPEAGTSAFPTAVRAARSAPQISASMAKCGACRSNSIRSAKTPAAVR
jgi:hypothetical protein